MAVLSWEMRACRTRQPTVCACGTSRGAGFLPDRLSALAHGLLGQRPFVAARQFLPPVPFRTARGIVDGGR